MLTRPHLMPGAVLATLRASTGADERFDESHYGNGIANGYKHAAWNALIAHYSRWGVRSVEDALLWAERITDLHEECFPNPADERQVDLDNNRTGRELYASLREKSGKRLRTHDVLEYIYENKEKIVFTGD